MADPAEVVSWWAEEARKNHMTLTMEVSDVKPSVLFLVVGDDGIVFACRDRMMVRAHDKDAGRWIKYTLEKLGARRD